MQATTLEFIEVAIEVIDDFLEDTNAVWRSVDDSEVTNPDEPWNITQGESQLTPIRIVFFQDNLEDRQFSMYFRKKTVVTGQVNGIMYKQGFDPKLKDVVEWEGLQLTVKNVDPIKPIDGDIIYIMEFGT